MKKAYLLTTLLVTLFFSFNLKAQVSSCPNSDFELGNLTNWQGATGYCCPIVSTTPGIVSGRHTIMTGTGFDPNTGNNIPVVAPGGLYSARLGNSNTGSQAETLTYSINVSSLNSLFIYKYAVVLEDPNHLPSEQPRFEIKVLNSSGVVINPTCGQYTVVSGSNIPGFQTYPPVTGDIRYKTWTTVGLDLSSYIGQNLTIEFSTGDCSLGGHYGYAYVDAYCSPLQINSTFCSGAFAAVLTAPIGFTYLWNNGSTNQSINVSNPTVGSTYSCILTSVTGCTVTISTVLTLYVPVADFTVTNACYDDATFQNTTVVPSGTTLNTFLWNFGDGSTSNIENPMHSFTTPGTYNVTFTISNALGCISTKTTAVTVVQAPTASFNYGSSAIFCNTDTLIKNAVLTGTNNYTGGVYSSTPPGLSLNSSTGAIASNTSASGTYTVSYAIPTANNCTVPPSTKSVTILQSPTASLNYSSTVFCGNLTTQQPINLSGTGSFTGGIFSSTSGLTLDSVTGAITPSSSVIGNYTVTYTLPVSSCPALTVTTTVEIKAFPTATINYASTPFCTTVTTPQPVSLSGTLSYSGGTFSAPSGLSINSSTGNIIPSSSTPGTYLVTYTIPSIPNCTLAVATTSVVITKQPTAIISYSNPIMCGNLTNPQSVNISGTGSYTGGIFSSTSGLTINSLNGDIIPNTSTAGNYIITYTTNPINGCLALMFTTNISIKAFPTATINYASTPFCTTVTTPQPVSLSGTLSYSGGTFSAPSGLSINSSTGNIIPSSSTPGTYLVTYTIPSIPNCTLAVATTSVVITKLPTVAISYANLAFCRDIATPQGVTLTGTGAYTSGIYSSTAGLALESNLGGITPSTSTAGNYVVTYTTNPSGGCLPVTATTNVKINPLPNPILKNGDLCFNASGVLIRNFLLDSGLNNTDYTFVWTLNGTTILGANQSVYTAVAIGNYSVIATNIATGCSSSQVFATIIAAQMASDFITSIDNSFTDNNVLTILVTGGTGPFIYQLDNQPFQPSNVYNSLPSGLHTISVTDATNCTVLSKEIAVFGYPKFFTPNGDGFNDFWNIFSYNNLTDAKIYIFDRFNKLVKQISPLSQGWDGTFNGADLPSTDYWFTIEYIGTNNNGVPEIKSFKSHFSLKR